MGLSTYCLSPKNGSEVDLLAFWTFLYQRRPLFLPFRPIRDDLDIFRTNAMQKVLGGILLHKLTIQNDRWTVSSVNLLYCKKYEREPYGTATLIRKSGTRWLSENGGLISSSYLYLHLSCNAKNKKICFYRSRKVGNFKQADLSAPFSVLSWELKLQVLEALVHKNQSTLAMRVFHHKRGRFEGGLGRWQRFSSKTQHCTKPQLSHLFTVYTHCTEFCIGF